MNVKNLKIMAASLCLSTTLLTGCSESENEISFGTDTTISYETATPQGTISYADLSNCGKIVTVENNEVTKTFLLIKTKKMFSNRYGNSYDLVNYIDLKSGTTIIGYKDYVAEESEMLYLSGENIEIIDELDITGYLFQQEFIKREYEVEEILTFFEEKIKPTLESSKKELVK